VAAFLGNVEGKSYRILPEKTSMMEQVLLHFGSFKVKFQLKKKSKLPDMF
jgi:hypothetical protein